MTIVRAAVTNNLNGEKNSPLEIGLLSYSPSLSPPPPPPLPVNHEGLRLDTTQPSCEREEEEEEEEEEKGLLLSSPFCLPSFAYLTLSVSAPSHENRPHS